MKRIFAIAMLGVALAGAHRSIAADSPSQSSCSLSAACLANGAACDPSNCPMPCAESCPPSCAEDGAAAVAAGVE